MDNLGSNIELVRLLRKGDLRAFDCIYNKYCHRLHKFVFMYLKQEEDAEGIVQEVFLKIWDAREKIDVYASFESFLFTIAYNSTMSLLRKRMSETRSREHLKSLQQIDTAATVIDEMEYLELNERVASLLELLTPRQREVFQLSRVEGLTHEEIAARLKISESTVNNHLVSVLKYIKSNLNGTLAVIVLYSLFFLS